jgi:oxygen-independent coproporphyrinogen III oxidase
MFSLYFHIPFCTKKCSYCHFYVIPDNEQHKRQLMEGFQIEWNKWLPELHGKKLSSIYFGGGTPALLGASSIAKILGWIQKSFPFDPETIEITLEANPENIHLDLMKGYSDAGINRVSIGIQSLDDLLLRNLGRIHNAQKARESVILTHRAGIKNISIDLMYDLPNQTLDIWQKTLHNIQDLPIQHLSLYNLTIEPHTLFFKNKTELMKLLPDEELSLSMYEYAVFFLEKMGLKQYEISAFALPDHQSRHNSGYWTARPFLGLGPSAFSYWNNHRFRNVANLNKYLLALNEGRSPVDFSEKLDPKARINELLAIRIRLLEGVNINEFQNNFGLLPKETHNALQKLVNERFLQKNNSGNIFSLTKRGILFYDTVAVELI